MTPTTKPTTPPAWIYAADLEPLWRAAFRAIERAGRSMPRTVYVTGLQEGSRREIGALIGRVLLDPTVRIDVGSLQDVLLDRCGHDLLDLVETVLGPIPDRIRAAAAADEARRGPVEQSLAGLSETDRSAWGETWAAGIHKAGMVRRFRLTADDLTAALKAALRLPVSGLSRPQFAAEIFGDAHALDPGTVRESLVLRGWSARTGSSPPLTPGDRRKHWETAGVLPDLVSSTCLLAGIAPSVASGFPENPAVPAADGGSVLERLQAAAAFGEPVHVTGWDLRVLPTVWAAQCRVLVCENPQVLEAVVNRFGAAVPVLCTSGQPSLVAMAVLRRLRAGGVRLDYHGDFDWSGLAIANRLIDEVGVRPWRMETTDYLAGLARTNLPLHGAAGSAAWSSTLGEVMTSRRIAVHEEVVLEALLSSCQEELAVSDHL